MPPWVLVCGSVAMDYVGRYRGSFASYQSRYDIEALNISLQLADLRSSFGGCGINITYGLKKLDIPVIPLSAAGTDFLDNYQQHLIALGVNSDHIIVDQSFPRCATALVISDDHGNQITCFHAGASISPLRELPRDIDGTEDCQIAILAPEDAPVMLRQGRDLHELGIPVIFDPGQGIAEFSREQILELLLLSDSAIFNLHEYEILKQNAGLTASDLEQMMQRIIITRAAEGVDVFENGTMLHVDAVICHKIADPTGCGDAFRSGYIYGLMHGYDALVSVRLGCLLAAINLEYMDTQTYDVDVKSLTTRYKNSYGESIPSG